MGSDTDRNRGGLNKAEKPKRKYIDGCNVAPIAHTATHASCLSKQIPAAMKRGPTAPFFIL